MTFKSVTYRNSLPSPFHMVHYFADHLSAADMKVVTALVESISIVKQDLQKPPRSVQRLADKRRGRRQVGVSMLLLKFLRRHRRFIGLLNEAASAAAPDLEKRRSR